MRLLYVGGPTALIELGEVRFITDPTLDPPGEYPVGSRVLTKTMPPAVGPEEVGGVDAVLLSHDQHADNLDRAGRDLALAAPLVLTTPASADRLAGPAVGLEAWSEHRVGSVLVAALPARHGPPGSEHLIGPVTGFLLRGSGLPTVYVSGDNAGLDVVEEIAARVGPVDVAILFAGGARTALLGDAYLTLSSTAAAAAARLLGARSTVVLHFEGWAHFSEGRESLAAAFGGPEWSGRVKIPAAGEWIEL